MLIGVDIYRYRPVPGRPGVLYEAIQIKGKSVVYNGKRRGVVDPNAILQLIEKYHMRDMQPRYGDSLVPLDYDEISLSDGQRLWHIHHEPSAPIDIGAFIRDIHTLAVKATNN